MGLIYLWSRAHIFQFETIPSRVPQINAQRGDGVNKTGHKIVLNRELSIKLIQKNSLPSMAHDKQKFHSAPKQRRPISTEVMSN